MDDVKTPLRKGWTTGACAAAAATAAVRGLIEGRVPDAVTVVLPKGLTPTFPVAGSRLADGRAEAWVIKDAGDDPDITHGATIRVTVERVTTPGGGPVFVAGPGVGTVTKPGLPLAVGQPAINPGPRAMIEANLRAIAGHGDFTITVAVDNGEKLAARTMNPRLGIVGGLSILGTTGVVIPYSCAAWIASIRQGIDVARAQGLTHLAAATGRTSEAAVKRLLGLEETALIEMGDFAGGVLKYLRDHPVDRLTLAGGFAKLAKLAAGHMDLHSKRSSVDAAFLARLAGETGAADGVVAAVARADSGAQALAAAGDFPLADAVAAKARQVARETVGDGVRALDVLIVDRSGKAVGRAA